MWKVIAAAAVLAGCTTQATLDAAPVARSVVLAENYQAVYARLNKMTRSCNVSPFQVDGQLYSDLGYGEVQMFAAGFAGSRPYLDAKVFRRGDGAFVEIKSLHPASAENGARWMEYWAKGGSQCMPAGGYYRAPPT